MHLFGHSVDHDYTYLLLHAGRLRAVTCAASTNRKRSKAKRLITTDQFWNKTQKHKDFRRRWRSYRYAVAENRPNRRASRTALRPKMRRALDCGTKKILLHS
jgi:hypothetical protein